MDATNFDAVPLYLDSSYGAEFNLTSMTGQWLGLLQTMLRMIAPDGLSSIFLPSVISNNLTSIRIAYYGFSFVFKSHFRELSFFTKTEYSGWRPLVSVSGVYQGRNAR